MLKFNGVFLATQGGVTALPLLITLGIMVLIMYFMIVRPEKKQQKKMELLLSSVEIGDSVITTAGFYGVVVDTLEAQGVVIVEFGSNKNCRIPMKKTSIIEVEKKNA